MTAKEQYIAFIMDKYKKLGLNKTEVAELMGKSQTWINNRLEANDLESIPKFRRLGSGPKAQYIFPASFIADFMLEANA